MEHYLQQELTRPVGLISLHLICLTVSFKASSLLLREALTIIVELVPKAQRTSVVAYYRTGIALGTRLTTLPATY